MVGEEGFVFKNGLSLHLILMLNTSTHDIKAIISVVLLQDPGVLTDRSPADKRFGRSGLWLFRYV